MITDRLSVSLTLVFGQSNPRPPTSTVLHSFQICKFHDRFVIFTHFLSEFNLYHLSFRFHPLKAVGPGSRILTRERFIIMFN